MNEDLLHFIWKFQLFDHANLMTQDSAKIVIKKPGQHNHDAGPDFSNARIIIDDTLWAGNVEIHIKASDWFAHNHQTDAAYNNVILHVVLEDDLKPGQYSHQLSQIPSLELKDRISTQLLSTYHRLKENRLWIPCAEHFPGVPKFTITHWLDRVLIDRIKEKSDRLQELLQHNKNDWRETFYQLLARNFGFKVNAEPFERLAKSLPLNIIAKHKDHPEQVEALLFGQAGLLNKIFTDQYPITLQKEYQFLSKKYNIHPIGEHEWNLLRLRPSNFPAIRISQYAQLLHQASGIFAKILENPNPKFLKKLFEVKASEYWNNHYQFDRKSSKSTVKKLGKKGIENILINSVVPFLFTYGQAQNDQSLKGKAIEILEDLPPENNRILKNWGSLGIKNKNAANSQSLLFLKKAYCDKKRCLECGIGMKVLAQ